MNAYPGWLTLREIDASQGWSKGTAFRRFKQVEPQLQESRDYQVLHHAQERHLVESLRASGRIYATSINVILLAPSTVPKLIGDPAPAARRNG
ncbi:MAG: hypothetical protein E6R07_08705 [Nevskiaceae bacterium]|nr:MAG: hypothetical protein E6R07_08705 [Nevskiaceae bacterium]